MEKGSSLSAGGGDVFKTGSDWPRPDTGQPIHHKKRRSGGSIGLANSEPHVQTAYLLRHDVTIIHSWKAAQM